MKHKLLLNKILTIAIIQFFIFVPFSPTFVAINQIDDFVDFNVDYSGFANRNTVRLTKQQADEVEVLFDNIKTRLDNVESRMEAEVIFNDALKELDKYGFLGSLDIQQAERLVLGKMINSDSIKFYDRCLVNESENNSNFLCLVAGNAEDINFVNSYIKRKLIKVSNWNNTLLSRLIDFARNNGYDHLLWILEDIERYIINYTVWVSIILGMLITNLSPIAFRNIGFVGIDEENPAEGWIISIGLNGIKSWEGTILGDIPPGFLIPDIYCAGIVGFNGIKISHEYFTGDPDDVFDHFFLGSALWVKNKEMI